MVCQQVPDQQATNPCIPTVDDQMKRVSRLHTSRQTLPDHSLVNRKCYAKVFCNMIVFIVARRVLVQ